MGCMKPTFSSKKSFGISFIFGVFLASLAVETLPSGKVRAKVSAVKLSQIIFIIQYVAKKNALLSY